MKLKLCTRAELAPGTAKKIEIEGRPPLALWNVEGSFYCTADTCTHGGASLGEEGHHLDETVECAWHGGMFDVRTGEATGAPCTEALKTYKVEVRGEEVFAVLDE
jgi:nitrite reductase/ring-hydroxylating ferredoxin subunit